MLQQEIGIHFFDFTIHYDKLIEEVEFATIYYCEHQTIKEPMCVKIISTMNYQPQLQILIDREIQILHLLLNIDHKNIIKIFHIHQENNSCYIFMEKHLKGNLIQYEKSLVIEGKSLTLTDILKILKDIIQGYQKLFQNNIIHRNLKPENLLVGNDGNIKICNYSFALFLPNNDLIQCKSGGGTSCYSAPQIIFDDKYSSKCDVYSLGIIIFELVFKQFPFPNLCFLQIKKSLQHLEDNSIQIPTIKIEGNSKQKLEIQLFLQRAIVYKEECRIAWQELFNKFLQENERNCFGNQNLRIRSITTQQNKNVLRQQQQSTDDSIFRNPQRNQIIDPQNTDIKQQNKTSPKKKEKFQIHQIDRRTLFRNTIPDTNFPNTSFQPFKLQQQDYFYKLIEIIFAKLQIVQGFIQQLNLFKQKFQILFNNIDYFIMNFYLTGYKYSLLLNIQDAIMVPKLNQQQILTKICQEGGINLEIEQYDSSKVLKIKNYKKQLCDLSEEEKLKFSVNSNIIEYLSIQLQQSLIKSCKENLQNQFLDEKIQELKETIDKKEQIYNYLLFIQEFRAKFENWKKSMWQDSIMKKETLTFFTYAEKISLLEIEYPMQNFAEIDSTTIFYQKYERIK